jgi:lipopolysaccharide/colanic/teichoic acid biosynthesis glycosyltransferase
MLTNLDARNTPEVVPFEKHEQQRRSIRRPQARIELRSTRGQQLYHVVRRGLDFTAALVLGLAALPIVMLATLAIKLTSRGPAVYTQLRTGRGGRCFTIYKLRTMVDNCESLTGPRWTIPGDPRITPVGWFLRRSHIDELPQLFNVLRGNMSLIGPRPERPEFVHELEKEIPAYGSRHAVLPGITGLAQVQLPPDTDLDSVRRKLLYDVYFVRHLSPLLDARIFVCTLLHLLGVRYATLQTLRLVPGPERVEAEPQLLPVAWAQRQAA